MSITARPRGRSIAALLGYQDAFADPAPADIYNPVRLYSVGLSDSEPLEDDPILGQGGHNTRDPNDPAPGLRRGAGPLAVPLCLNQIGLWLTALMGPPVTTNEEAVYTHVFASGEAALPPATLEVAMAPSMFRRHIGIGLSAARFRVAQEAGFRRVEFDSFFRSTTRHTSSQAGTPLTALALNRVVAARGIVRIDDVAAGNVNALDASYDNRMTPREHVGDDGLVSGHDLDQDAASALTLTARLTSAALADLAGDGATHKLEIEYPGVTAGQKLILEWGAVRFARNEPTVEGPGGIEVTLNGRAQQKADAPMLTATLVNAITSYALPGD